MTLPLERLDELVERMRDAVADGQKVYWICPLVEESEEIKLMSAEDRFAMLQPIFGDAVGLVHGRMKRRATRTRRCAPSRPARPASWSRTTVIEVGVDVPDATIMVIEHAERFGLAQLHQLRGRVGRGDEAVDLRAALQGRRSARPRSGGCQVMRETEDGFRISEEDLKLRGEGEVLGTRQSGTPGFQVARIEAHADLLEIARDDARLLLSRDPELQARARRGDPAAALSVRARRGGAVAARRLSRRSAAAADGCGGLMPVAATMLLRPPCAIAPALALVFRHDQPGRDHQPWPRPRRSSTAR